jgi:hypothetical protein
MSSMSVVSILDIPPLALCVVKAHRSVVTQAGPSAFSNIGENYYYVFIGCCAVYFVLIYFYFP